MYLYLINDTNPENNHDLLMTLDVMKSAYEYSPEIQNIDSHNWKEDFTFEIHDNRTLTVKRLYLWNEETMEMLRKEKIKEQTRIQKLQQYLSDGEN